MKKKIVIFLFMLPYVVFAQQQVVNSNFENWTDATHPNVWKCNIPVVLPPPIGTIYISTAERTSDSYNGQYAAKLQTKSNFNYVIPGIIQLGNLALDPDFFPTMSGGYPFVEKPSGFSTFIKYFPVQKDTAMIYVFLTKYDTLSHSRDTIGGTFYLVGDTVSIYNQITLPIVYVDTFSIPDSINIVFLSSNPLSPKLGSTLYVDSVELFYSFFPFPTLARNASEITNSSFTANWYSSPLSADYVFDLATDKDFLNFVDGYQNLDVTGSLIYQDTLSQLAVSVPSTITDSILFYRVSVNYGDSLFSQSSNTITVNLLNSPNNILYNNLSDINFSVFNKTLFLSNIQQSCLIEIFDINGRIICSKVLTANSMQIALKQSGLYIVKLSSLNSKKQYKIYIK